MRVGPALNRYEAMTISMFFTRTRMLDQLLAALTYCERRGFVFSSPYVLDRLVDFGREAMLVRSGQHRFTHADMEELEAQVRVWRRTLLRKGGSHSDSGDV